MPDVSRHPVFSWIPAFAGMTVCVNGYISVYRHMKKAGLMFIAACLLFFCSPASLPGADSESSPSIRFLGAARTIGGSAYLMDTGTLRLLVDFGAHPAEQTSRTKDQNRFFDPATIDYVLLTHAHADHAGRIPLLYRRGFRGRVIGTEATRTLLRITLDQSLAIMKEKSRADYDRADVERMLKNYLALPYGQKFSPTGSLSLRLRNAGHILGSAIFEIWIKDREGPIKIVAAGDLGNGVLSLLPPPATLDEGDYILVESTYGPYRREETDDHDFGNAVRKALLAGGSVLIPAFTLDRTQKVLYVLGRLKKAGVIPAAVPVYLDSRTAMAITQVYRRFRKEYHPDLLRRLTAKEDPLSFPGLRQVPGSEALNAHEAGRPAIFLTSSGMLDHGQAPRHLLRMIGDERNLLAIVGWQAPGTLGYDLQDGAGMVRIPVSEKRAGEPVVSYVERPVKMQVKTFGVFSNHADGCGILTWLAHFPRTRKVIVVHGEEENATGLARAVEENLGFPAVAPRIGDVIPLSSRAPLFPRRLKENPCQGIQKSTATVVPTDR